MDSKNRLIAISLVVGIVLGFIFSKVIDVRIGINPRIRHILSKVRDVSERNLNVKDVLKLCSFDKKSDIRKVGKSKVTMEISSKYASNGKYSLKCVFPDGGGAIEFYDTLPRNWTGYKTFKFDVYSEEDGVPLSLYIKDTKNTSYYDRFNLENIHLHRGWNNIEIPVSAIDKKLRLYDIHHIRIFLWRVKGVHILYFDNFRLISSKGDKLSKKPIKIIIYPNKEKRKISHLLYGSNLEPKMESGQKIVDFIKDIGITCFRFPGGGSPGWRWRTGWADFNSKMKNMPLSRIAYLIDFCRLTNTKLIMQVNIESGTPQDAAALVEYMNKKANFRVDYWELGNEVYGKWDKAYTTPKEYIKLIKKYSQAMKSVDSTIKIGADWGETFYDKVKWDQTIIKGAADYIDFVSYHWYPNHISKRHKVNGKSHPAPKELMANAMEIPDIIRRFNRIIAEYAPQRRGKIEFTFLEWDGAWDAPSSDPKPPYAKGVAQWSLANAVFYADSLGQFAANGVTVSAQYSFQECMFGLIRGWDPAEGWGGKAWDEKTIRPKAFAIKIFSKHFGGILIENKVEGSPVYYKSQDWWPSSYTGKVPYITCYASKFKGENKLGIILINKHPDKNFNLDISIKGKVSGNADIWILTGPSLMSQNDGSPGAVKIEKLPSIRVTNKFKYTLPAHSVVAMEIEL